MKSPGGMFMEDVDVEMFDGAFFNISPLDCIAMDPQQRQLLEVTYECLENSGISLESISGKSIGCLVAVNLTGKQVPFLFVITTTDFVVDYDGVQARDPEDRPESATVGLSRAILSNRISHFLNVNGPRYGMQIGVDLTERTAS
jgi:acyl transferase domain-containing protein